jgi:hypothetical protein
MITDHCSTFLSSSWSTVVHKYSEYYALVHGSSVQVVLNLYTQGPCVREARLALRTSHYRGDSKRHTVLRTWEVGYMKALVLETRSKIAKFLVHRTFPVRRILCARPDTRYSTRHPTRLKILEFQKCIRHPTLIIQNSGGKDRRDCRLRAMPSCTVPGSSS